MSKKPSLQEYLKNNPGKGLNDYFEAYGQPEETTISTPPPVEENIQPQQDNTYVEQPRSYIDPTNAKKAKIDILNIIASLAIIAGFFLPWLNIEGFQNAEEFTLVSGMDIYSIFNNYKFEAFSDQSYYTIYLIPVGAITALIGELLRNWAVRIIGQMLAISFGFYWMYKFYYLFEKAEIRPEEMVLMDFIQYGFLIVLAGVIMYLVDIIRTTFGSQR